MENRTPAAGIGGGTSCNTSFDQYGVGVRAGVQGAPQLLVFGKRGYVLNGGVVGVGERRCG